MVLYTQNEGGKNPRNEEDETMTNSTYTFTKDGKKYSASGANRFDAQLNIELAFGISLKGAKFEQVYKLRVVRTGRV